MYTAGNLQPRLNRNVSPVLHWLSTSNDTRVALDALKFELSPPNKIVLLAQVIMHAAEAHPRHFQKWVDVLSLALASTEHLSVPFEYVSEGEVTTITLYEFALVIGCSAVCHSILGAGWYPKSLWEASRVLTVLIQRQVGIDIIDGTLAAFRKGKMHAVLACESRPLCELVHSMLHNMRGPHAMLVTRFCCGLVPGLDYGDYEFITKPHGIDQHSVQNNLVRLCASKYTVTKRQAATLLLKHLSKHAIYLHSNTYQLSSLRNVHLSVGFAAMIEGNGGPGAVECAAIYLCAEGRRFCDFVIVLNALKQCGNGLLAALPNAIEATNECLCTMHDLSELHATNDRWAFVALVEFFCLGKVNHLQSAPRGWAYEFWRLIAKYETYVKPVRKTIDFAGLSAQCSRLIRKKWPSSPAAVCGEIFVQGKWTRLISVQHPSALSPPDNRCLHTLFLCLLKFLVPLELVEMIAALVLVQRFSVPERIPFNFYYKQ